MAGWYFAGSDSESSTKLERNEVSRQINAVLARLGSVWMLQVEALRVPATGYPKDSHFPDPISRPSMMNGDGTSKLSVGISKGNTR